MGRHFGTLPAEYVEHLSRMTLPEIAKEAARMRGDGKRCGTATALILRWAVRNVVANDAGARSFFYQQYQRALQEEIVNRELGLSVRPEDRPVKGPSRGGSRAGKMQTVRDRHDSHAYSH